MLVHYHAYGDPAKVPGLVEEHSERIRKLIDFREEDEVGRLIAEYQVDEDKLVAVDAELESARKQLEATKTKTEKARAEGAIAKIEKQREKLTSKLAERDERVAESRRQAENDRMDVQRVGEELRGLYAEPDELLKHTRVVGIEEIGENEFNLNIPRFVDTFEPEPRLEVKQALQALRDVKKAASEAETELNRQLQEIGYGG